MKKMMMSSASLLGASLLVGSVYAAAPSTSHSIDYLQNSPTKASLVITLSGACSAKISLPVTKVSYGMSYTDTAGVVDENSTHAYLDVNTPDSAISVNASSDADSNGQKMSDGVKKGKRAVGFNLVGSGYYDIQAYFGSLASGIYDNQIKCKDGKTLQQQMLPGWTAYYDANGNKVTGAVAHTDSTSTPTAGTYKAKFVSTGSMETPSQCKQKGTLASADYSVVCAPAKSIKITVTAMAQGTSSPAP